MFLGQWVQGTFSPCSLQTCEVTYRGQNALNANNAKFFYLKKQQLFTAILSQRDFSHWKLGLTSPGKASCDRVALPSQLCVLGVLVFP